MPRTVHRGRGTAARVLWCDARARRRGVKPGQTLASARAGASDLASVEATDRCLAEARWEGIARLLRVSPRIAADGPLRFWVEPVYLGRRDLERWCASVGDVLSGLGPVSVGVGGTATLAWAAACSVPTGHRIVPRPEARAFLDGAPLEVLEIDSDALDVLAALGVRTVGQLRAFDPVSLGMRFGPALADARRRADGRDPRRPTTPRPSGDEEVRVELDDEVDGLEPIAFLLAGAADRFASALRRRGVGATRARLVLSLRGGSEHGVEVRTSAPVADGHAMIELLRTRLEHARLPAPVTGFVLRAESTSATATDGRDLFGRVGRDPAAREVALERLRTRFGRTAVCRAGRVETGPTLARARWAPTDRAGGAALPWRALEPPSPVENGRARVAGRLRRIRRLGRVERESPPWWEDGVERVSLVAWAELEGPILVLLRGRCDARCDDRWEVVAWVD